MASKEQKQMLQFLLQRPLVSVKELQKAYTVVFEKNVEVNELKIFVRQLNDLLKPSLLAIKNRLCEDSNEEHYALISLVETEAAKHTAEFTPLELDLFKLILKEILASETGTVSSIDCINYSSQIPRMGKTEAQKALEKFVSSQWLKEKEGEISFTVRTLLELEPLLLKLEPDLTPCTICNCLAVKSAVCQNESCGARCHRYCLSKLSRGKSSLKCPACSHAWSSLDTESPAASQGSSQPSTTGRRRTRMQSSSDSD